MWWDNTKKTLCLTELTVCYDTNFEEATLRKLSKYKDLAGQARVNYYRTTILTIQVGSQGVPDYSSFSKLSTMLEIPDKQLCKYSTGEGHNCSPHCFLLHLVLQEQSRCSKYHQGFLFHCWFDHIHLLFFSFVFFIFFSLYVVPRVCAVVLKIIKAI